MEPSHRSLPKQANSERFSACHQKTMQNRPAHTEPGAVGKTRVYLESAAHKANPAKRMGVQSGNVYAQPVQREDSVGHQAFTASFIDGGGCSIGHHHFE